MPKFIVLHGVREGNPFYVDANLIVIMGVQPSHPGAPTPSFTRIDFDHAGSIQVRETPDDILKLMGEGCSPQT